MILISYYLCLEKVSSLSDVACLFWIEFTFLIFILSYRSLKFYYKGDSVKI